MSFMKLSIVRFVKITLLSFVSSMMAPDTGLAFQDGAFRVGLALYQQNSLGEITKTADGSPSMTGSFSYPVFVKYDYLLTTEWYVSPQLSYTPIGRDSSGAATTTTMAQFILPVGFDLYRWTESSLDWQFGVGLTHYSIKGNGGTDTLYNGSTPTVFVKPSRSTTALTGLFLVGTSLGYGSSRFGFDFIFEGLLSEKRSPSLVLSYAYTL